MKIRLAAVMLVATLAGCLAATLALQDGPREQGESALKDRDWAKAIPLLTAALAQAKTGQDDLLYLLATAQQNAAQHDAAIATLDRLLKDYPTTALRMKALFKKADVLAARKEFALAAQLYDAQVAAILAPDRRKRLAMIYVDAGREFLNPKDPKDPAFVPDFAAAHGLLSKSLELEALGADEEGVRADLVACERQGKFPPQQLLKSCETFEEKYPGSAKLDEVLFAHGVALRDLNRPHDAEKTWTRLATGFAASKRAPEGLYAAALLFVSEDGRTGGTERLRRALAILRRLTRDFPGSEQGPRAAYLAGIALSQDEDLREEGRKELLAFAAANPKHERAPEALLAVAQLHLADQDDAKAIAAYEDFLKRFPDSALWPGVRASVPTVRFNAIGRATARKAWAEVRSLGQDFIDTYPTDARAAQVAFQMASSLKEEKKFKEAVEAALKLAAKYPDSPQGHPARLLAAELLATELEDFEASMKELAKVGGAAAPEAQQFLKKLQNPALAISSERVFKVGEAPAVKLTVRNLETVKFRFWALDLKDYFEKKASTSGIQDLEVSVIAPEKEWEVPVQGYKRFKELKLDVELPRKDPGAYIVTASSGRFETTTVVLVSDLAMIARAGRKGATVIVENMKTGERLQNPGLSTAADAKHLKAWTPGTTASSLSFLAEAPGGLAFRDLDVAQLPVPPERKARALILTDRRIYAPRDEVRVRLWIRDVADNAFVPPKEKKYRLEVVSAQGVPFYEVERTPSGAGTAVASFRLPRGLADSFQIRVFERSKPTETLVGEQTVRIGGERPRSRYFDLMTEDKPLFRGDPLAATLILRDAWDRPMPGRQVRVMLPGDSGWKDQRTGPDGTFAVEVRETDALALGAGAMIYVQHEDVGETFTIPLLPRGVLLSFDASSRLREPHAAGEAKTLRFTAKRADDAPVSRPFQWRVLRTNEAAEWSTVASGEVATDNDGKGSITFTPKEGGLHRVTLSMKDDEGMPTRIDGELLVFDEKEESKLRLLSAADEFEPGLPFEVQVLSRLDRGLAFVTVESETVEQVVAVTLEKGRNTVRLAAPPSATRDFSVCVMMMQGNAFHSEVRDFRLKEFELKVEASKKEYRPGERASVTVTAKPGSEVTLVAADRLLSSIDTAAFLANRRGRLFSSESSAALAFQGQTVQLEEQVLEAIDRLASLANAEAAPRIMLPKEEAFIMGVGVGGGSGGRYGGRFGGRENLVARGGGSRAGEFRGPGAALADPAPLYFGSAVADGTGRATFEFELPQDWGNYVAMAWAADGSNAIPSRTVEFKARAPVTVRVRAPESAVEGEKTSVIALLTNHSAQEQEATLSFGGDLKVKIPARSTLEKSFEWTAAPTSTFAMDGIPQQLRTEMRPAAPSVLAESGGAFTARTVLAPEGRGKVRVRYAVGPAELLESLGEGQDPFTPASDAAARLLAAIARHRYGKTEATKGAVMEYRALRAAGLADAAGEDLSWVVLRYLAEAEAKAAEFDVQPDPALLRQRFSQAASDDAKALMLFALARGGEAEYGFVYRLWRGADALPPRGLASLSLALLGTKKADEARGVLGRLAKAAKEDHWDAVDSGMPDASNTSYATTALAALAFAELDPASPLLGKARAWLLARAPGSPFERALLALAMQSTKDQSAVTELKIDGLPVRGYGEVSVENATVDPTGAGTYYALARRETGRAPDPAVRVSEKRTVHWPVPVVEGVTASLMTVSAGDATENPPAPMEKVAAGESFVIEVELTVAGPTRRYHVFELPRPTGLRVRADSLRVLLPPQDTPERKIQLVIAAYADAPGVYPGLAVLDAGLDYRAGWRWTPGERLAAGRIQYEKKQWKQAKETLAPLFASGTIVDAAMIEAARMLAYSAIELKEHDTVVRFFEILKEKSPAEVVPFDKIRAVGLAYAAVNEHERAMQVHSGTCDAYFLQEANVIGALDDLGRTRQSTDEMKRLLSDHPDTPLNRETLYGMAVRLYSASREAPLTADKDRKKLTRSEMLAECSAALERTLAWFPGDPDADRAALTLGSAYLEEGKLALAERTARASVARYPKSRHQDGFDYTVAFAQFGQRKFNEALVQCDRLETFDYGNQSNPGGMRDRAVLIKAQIYHAKGELDKALENYRKLRATSPDAARSMAYLEREAIAVPDVTVTPLAKPSDIELEYAGVSTAQVRAYKVDLAMLAIRRKGLGDAASIEVAGIKPVFEKSYKLDAPNTRRREKQRLALDLKDPGAYVVGVTAGDFFAGGLVLRSNLAMTVQEDPEGTVRVNVSDVAAGGFAEGVKVTIFGTEDHRIVSDKTDLRGIWESHGVRGAAVVVAEKDGHVAIHRGQAALGHQPPRPKPMPAQAPNPAATDALQEQIKGLNEQLEKRYGDNNKKQQQGVEVERTKK